MLFPADLSKQPQHVAIIPGKEQHTHIAGNTVFCVWINIIIPEISVPGIALTDTGTSHYLSECIEETIRKRTRLTDDKFAIQREIGKRVPWKEH